MAEPITRQSALVGHYAESMFGANIQAPGIELKQRQVGAIIQLNGIDATTLEQIQHHFGLDEALAQQTVVGSYVTLLWTGPQQWLLVSEHTEPAFLITELEKMLAGTNATATDLSHGRVIVQIAGSQARELLAKGCPLNIQSVEAGDCATTHLGAMTVIIHWREADVCDIYVSRSFAVSLWEWLLDAAGEFGCHSSAAVGGEWTQSTS